MSLEALQSMNGRSCACGREHRHGINTILCGSGVLQELPALLKRRNIQKPFVFCDGTTVGVAGERVRKLLDRNGFSCVLYALDDPFPEPDEKAVGSMCMHFDASCDAIVAVGSGVVNDLGKVLAALTGRPYAIVATAPSVDGYASATSSVVRDGLKVSLEVRCPDIILGDTDILKNAPMRMLQAGLGDMLAKYVSLAEWRISQIINGEYYCPEVEGLVRDALATCVENADGLISRDETAVRAVFEGLTVSGVAMTYAQASRPASGVEHYISHGWDMRFVEFGTPRSLHGVQCALGTLIALRSYEKLRKIKPDRDVALAAVAAFDYEAWKIELKRLYGRAADEMIRREESEKKYDKRKHAARLERIFGKWDEICAVIDTLPSARDTEDLLRRVGAPVTPEEAGLESESLPLIFKATKDVRDKYILSRLLWDLGILDGWQF